MNEASDRRLQEWLDYIDDIHIPTWEQMPSLDLYMDQVITLMNSQLAPLSVETDRPLTPSMINNYVKDEVMPRPDKKRYTREHLTALSIIYMLKAEFSLPEIREMVNGLQRFYEFEELYDELCGAQISYLHDAAASIENFHELSEADRYMLAVKLSLEANAKRIAASRLLSSLTPEDATSVKSKKKKKDTE